MKKVAGSDAAQKAQAALNKLEKDVKDFLPDENALAANKAAAVTSHSIAHAKVEADQHLLPVEDQLGPKAMPVGIARADGARQARNQAAYVDITNRIDEHYRNLGSAATRSVLDAMMDKTNIEVPTAIMISTLPLIGEAMVIAALKDKLDVPDVDAKRLAEVLKMAGESALKHKAQDDRAAVREFTTTVKEYAGQFIPAARQALANLEDIDITNGLGTRIGQFERELVQRGLEPELKQWGDAYKSEDIYTGLYYLRAIRETFSAIKAAAEEAQS